jgi:hypothetical protein
LEEHHRHVFEFLTRISIFPPAADGGKQARGYPECREAPRLLEILIAGRGKCEKRANHGVREAHVERDCLGAEVPEAVLQILPERGEADRLDGNGEQQSMLLVGITDIDFLWPQTAHELESSLSRTPCSSARARARRRTSPENRWYRMNGGLRVLNRFGDC